MSTELMAPAHSTVSSNSGTDTSTPSFFSVSAISSERSLSRSKSHSMNGMPFWRA